MSQEKPIVSHQPARTPGPKLTPQNYFSQRPTQKFQTGLFSCFSDIKICLCASCCLPCLFNRTSSVMDPRGSPNPESEWFGGPCAIYTYWPRAPAAARPSTRARAAARSVKSTTLRAMRPLITFLSCCCTGCAAAQEDIEVRKLEEEKRLAFQTGQQNLAQQNL